MRESLMIRPFVELENSFLRAWHPSGGWLPPCFHKYYRTIPVDEGKMIPLQDRNVANRDPRRRFVGRNFITNWRVNGWRCYRSTRDTRFVRVCKVEGYPIWLVGLKL